MIKAILPFILICTQLTICGCESRPTSQQPQVGTKTEKRKVLRPSLYDDEYFKAKQPVFPGGEDSLRCYLAKNIRYDEEILGGSEWPSLLTIDYIVGEDCQISFEHDCVWNDVQWTYGKDDYALEYMKKEAMAVLGNLRYEQPAMVLDTVTNEWKPIAIQMYAEIIFRSDAEASLYDKTTIVKNSEIYPDIVGYDWLVYRKLRLLTTDAEKVDLYKNSPSYEVKVNAVVGLIESGNIAYKKLLPSLLSDTTTLRVCEDDCIWPVSVKDYFFEVLQRSTAKDNSDVKGYLK